LALFTVDVNGRSINVSAKLLKMAETEMFDITDRKNHKGKIFVYLLKDEAGQWNINAFAYEDGSKCVVRLVSSDCVTPACEQLKRTSMLFISSGPDTYYSLVKFSSMSQGRLKKGEIEDETALGPEFEQFEVLKYGDLKPGSRLRNKLIIRVRKTDTDSMVKLFYIEKILPLKRVNLIF